MALTGMTGEAARLTAEAMLRNLTIAGRLGCLTAAGLHDMRRGQSPTITLGPYAGDQLSVDHIIPCALAPPLDHVIANLELMPLRMNIGKRDRMTPFSSRHRPPRKVLPMSRVNLLLMCPVHTSARGKHFVETLR